MWQTKKLDQICWYGLQMKLKFGQGEIKCLQGYQWSKKITLALQPEAYLLVFNKLCASFKYRCW